MQEGPITCYIYIFIIFMTIDVESNTTKESKGVIVIYTCSPTDDTGKRKEELYNLWEK